MVINPGKISLKDLEFNCIIGTLPYERENEQPIVLNVSCFLLEETLVVETAKYILEHYPKALAAEVRVCKPNAIPGAAGAESSVVVRR